MDALTPDEIAHAVRASDILLDDDMPSLGGRHLIHKAVEGYSEAVARISALEYENKALREENATLRGPKVCSRCAGWEYEVGDVVKCLKCGGTGLEPPAPGPQGEQA